MNTWLDENKIKQINFMAKLAHDEFIKNQTHGEQSSKLVQSLDDLIKSKIKNACYGLAKDKICDYLGSGYHAAYKAIETYNNKYDFHHHMISNIKYYVRGDFLKDNDSKMIMKFSSRVMRSYGKKYKKFVMNSENSHLSDDEKIFKFASENDLSVVSVRQIHEYFFTSVSNLDSPEESSAFENLPEDSPKIKIDDVVFIKDVLRFVSANFEDKEKDIFFSYYTDTNSVDNIALKYGISRQYCHILINKMISKIKKKFNIK